MIEGYHYIETIDNETNFILYRAVEALTNEPVLILMGRTYQTPKSHLEELEKVAAISSEMTEATHTFKLRYENAPRKKPYLVAQDMGAIQLKTLMEQKRLYELNDLLIIKQFASILAQVHQQDYIHRSVIPTSFMITPKKCKLIGVQYIDALKIQTNALANVHIEKRFAPYMSPEQTGRIGKFIDTRSDFYSLGILLYQWATGELPFRANDEVQWLHAHISETPTPPHLVDQNVSLRLSMIIMKLLDKNPEQRYQSAYGLIKDCERLMELTDSSKDDQLTLGDCDKSTTLEFSSTLIGREKEIDKLRTIYSNTVNEAKVVLIEGEAGVGKTSIVQHVFKGVQKDTYFIQASFEKRKGHQAYHGFINGFSQLIDQIIAQGNAEVMKWRTIFKNGLGDSLSVFYRIFPDILLILDEDSVDSEPINMEAHSFKQAIRRFLQCFCEQGKTIIFFFDNMQWFDEASLSLFEEDKLTVHVEKVLFILAFQLNEKSQLDRNDKARQMLLKNVSIDLVLTLQPLNRQQLLLWLNSTFTLSKDMEDETLTTLFERTAGNPYRLQQELISLYEKKQFTFNHIEGYWSFSQLPIIEERQETNIEALPSIIEHMSEIEVELWEYCLCLGEPFHFELLQQISNYSATIIESCFTHWQRLELVKRIESLNIEELVLTFINDQVWTYLYANIDKQNRMEKHYKIAEAMLAQLSELAQIPSTIVDHYNKCTELPLSKEKGLEIAQYNLMAADNYAAVEAHHSACVYYEHGLKWVQDDPSLEFILNIGKARCLYALANNEEAQALTTELYQSATTVKEKVEVLRVEIKMTNHLAEPEKVIQLCLDGLALLGYAFPKRLIKFHILYELLNVHVRMNRVLQYQPLKQEGYSEQEKMVFSLLEAMGIAVYGYKKDLYALHVLRLVKLQYPTFSEGNSSLILSQYAMVLSEGVHHYKKAYHVSKWATEKIGQNSDSFTKGVTRFIFSGFIQHWQEPLVNKLTDLEIAYETNKKSGNLVVAGGCLIMSFNAYLMLGHPLTSLLKHVEDYRIKAQTLRLEEFNYYFQLVEKVMEALKNWQETVELNQEIEALYKWIKTHFQSRETTLSFFSLLMSFYWTMLGRYEKCLEEVEDSKYLFEGRNSVLGASQVDYWVYHSLSICMAGKSDKAHRKIVSSYLKRVTKWKKVNKDNFESRYDIIEGCYYAIKKSFEHARNSLQKALKLSTTQGLFHHQAIIRQLLNYLYIEQNKPVWAQMYIQQANESFQKWGAETIVEQNRQLYQLNQTNQVKSFPVEGIDSLSLMKAAQVLSKEMVLEKVLQQLMNIALQNAGANSGLFILHHNDQLLVEVKGYLQQGDIQIEEMDSVSIQAYEQAPATVIDYVIKLKKALLFEDLMKDFRFSNDPYMPMYKPKSVLVVPVIHHHQLFGVLYLENNLFTHAFTKQDLLFLELLMTQAAIAIENARLYKEMQVLNESLEEKVKKRTYYLERTQQQMAETMAKKSVLEERNRIARDIHDVVGHTLTTAIVQAEASRRLFEKNGELSMEKLELTQGLIRKGLNEIRHSVHLLNQFDSIDDVQLTEVVKLVISEVEVNTGVIVDLHLNMKTEIKQNELNQVVYYVLKEAFTNGIKHGNSSNFSIHLTEEEDCVKLVIQDNGKGVNKLEYGFGLHSMKKRIEQIGGNLQITSSKKSGTTLIIETPYK
ncbi:AAA family ATPase [Alkalihalobacillus pseudalcaliphilus]|uniref:AAA family ATPase n=1 Tax=Alkalihalobacillus pseudalcaliphilus TaxID=79884 RepID=UPI00064DFC21|nr:AAA family ATPase [Alkalihalobacillus pseudalcaliphilus]KMK78174.1 hypothetical protein AB990_01685 [Alkalihalobacillus pseudalcaliphilus]